jgi:CubicO group peptidase (beta-lactamase class C family)
VLGDIVESITGTTLGLYLKQHIFEPLGMKDTTLGIAADRQKAREVCLNLAGEYSGADSGRQFQHLSAAEGGIPKSNWNSDYWRELGAPWGGMTTTVGDLAILCQAILAAEAQLLSGEGIGLMTRAHTHGDQISVVSLRTFPRV